MPQEFLKHEIPGYLVRDTDLFSLRLSHNKMTTAKTTIAIQCEIHFAILAKMYCFFGVQNLGFFYVGGTGKLEGFEVRR